MRILGAKSALLLASLSLALQGCGWLFSDGGRNQKKTPNTPNLTDPNSPHGVQNYGILMGTVRDFSGDPIDNVEVRIAGKSATSNSQGYFSVSEIPEQERALIQFKKDGFVPTMQILRVRSGEGSFVTVQLGREESASTFISSAGGTVGSGVAKVEIKPGTLINSNGSPYTGTVKMSITAFDPSTPEGMKAFPGNFEGVQRNGEIVPIQSFGYADITPRDEQGNPLQLASGKTATVTFPIGSNQTETAPETIPLWYFNFADGQWHEEGVAKRVGNTYVGDVPHFSIWNCDVAASRSHVIGRVVDCENNNDPIRGARVTAQNVRAGWTSGESSTPDDGTFKIPVNANEPVDLWASKNGTDSEHRKFIAPGNGDVIDLGDICLNAPRLKITLSWDAVPEDLDAHLTFPSPSGKIHVYYGQMSGNGASLDTDDQNGFGPEIVSVYKLFDGVYRFSVHHYAGSGGISASNALVNLVVDKVGIYQARPPAGIVTKNDLWNVWDVVVKNGRVVEVISLDTVQSNVLSHDVGGPVSTPTPTPTPSP